MQRLVNVLQWFTWIHKNESIKIILQISKYEMIKKSTTRRNTFHFDNALW